MAIVTFAASVVGAVSLDDGPVISVGVAADLTVLQGLTVAAHIVGVD